MLFDMKNDPTESKNLVDSPEAAKISASLLPKIREIAEPYVAAH